MNWFKRKKREDRFRIAGYPDNRNRAFQASYLLLLATALFTSFLMIHTAAVLSSPLNFITGGGGQINWTTESSGAT